MKTAPLLLILAAAHVACDPITLDVRGDEVPPLDQPPLEIPQTTCEKNGHECLSYDLNFGFCPDSSTPFDDECGVPIDPRPTLLCCVKIVKTDCEEHGDLCKDDDFGGVCPGSLQFRPELSCDAPGRPRGKICCAPEPPPPLSECEQNGVACFVDPMLSMMCPLGWDPQPLRCNPSLETGDPQVCCAPHG